MVIGIVILPALESVNFPISLRTNGLWKDIVTQIDIAVVMVEHPPPLAVYHDDLSDDMYRTIRRVSFTPTKCQLYKRCYHCSPE